MPAWIKTVEIEQIVDEVLYFIALKPATKLGRWMFFSEPKNGKRQFSTKPGIALKYKGSAEFRDYIKNNDKLCAVEVPSNSDSKWRARR